MVGKVLGAMNKEIRGLHETAYLLAFFSVFSQLLALIRDRTFAHFFGAGPELDAYFAAFRIPDVVFALLTLFVSSFALVPLLSERGGVMTEQSRKLIGSVLVTFGTVSIAISLLLFVFMPRLVPTLFPGFPPSVLEDVVLLSSIMLLQPVILGLSSIITSVVQTSRKFILFALAPIFYNVGIIFGALFLYPTLGISGLAWGVVLGAVLHLAVQTVPFFVHTKVFIPQINSHILSDTARVMRLSFPRALALSSHQLLMLVFVAAASLAALGSVSTLSFAFNLQSVPFSVIAVSYAAALFPSLALLWSKGDTETFVKEVWAAIRHLIFWITPAIALIVVLRAHIVRVVLGSGAFSWPDTRLTAAILAGFVISLLAQGALLIFSRAYYAAGRSFEPVLVNVGAALVASITAFTSIFWFRQHQFVRYFLEDLFRVTDIPGTEAIMIALSYSLVMTIAALVFMTLYAVRFGFERRIIATFLISFAASVIAAAGAYGTLQIVEPWVSTDTFIGIFTQGLSAGIVGIALWAATLSVLKNREFSEVLLVFKKIAQRL